MEGSLFHGDRWISSSPKGILAPMLDFSRFEWLSFDCYGTLIDWETGLLGYLRPLLRGKGCGISDARILALYSELEPRQQAGHYRSYREVLAGVVRDFARALHFEVSDSEAGGLAESIPNWQPFADTVAGLQRLRSRYKLAVLSNIDDDLLAYTAPKLEVRFDAVVTAQQVHSYKPSLNNFEGAPAAICHPPRAPAACRGELVPRCGTCAFPRNCRQYG